MRTSTRVPGTACLLAVIAGLACSESPVGPGAGLRLIAPGSATDTILALPSAPLVVEVRDEDGRPEAGVLVSFVARPPAGATVNEPERGVYVCPVASASCAEFHPGGYSVSYSVNVTTDAAGRASARVQFGVVAGAATIEVRTGLAPVGPPQPGVGERLEVHYTTLVGALARVTTPSADTAVYVGAGYELQAQAADRFGNPRTEPVTLTALDPAVATIASGRVTAVGTGRARIRIQAGPVDDTAYVSVPPAGLLVAMGWSPDTQFVNRLGIVRTDGSGRRPVLTTYAVNGSALPAWTPDGSRFVIQQESATDEGQLVRLDTLGNQHWIFEAQGNFVRSLQPAFSRTEGALYFYGANAAGEDGIFRANPDGSGATFLFAGAQPAPSPDGSRLAYVSGQSLFVRDIGSGAVTPLAADPVLPRWSPSGGLIAYIETTTGGAYVTRPDGSETRRLGDGGLYDSQVAWSPDGLWLAVSRATGPFEIIRVADGVRLPIAGTWGLHQLAWRP